MKPFEYLDPKNLEDACTVLSRYHDEAKIIAGGQNLLVILGKRLISPKYLISIKRCSDIEYIKEQDGCLKLGALTTHRTIENSDLIRQKVPMLTNLEYNLGCVQTRNWGTIGGNLSQASPATDLAPALIALGARCQLQSVRGTRTMSLEDFFVDYRTTALATDEILVELEVPVPPPYTAGIYRKEAVRFADPPIASVAVVVSIDKQGIVKSARIVLQAVGVTPIRAREAEKVLIEKKVEDKLLDVAATMAAREAKPISDVYGTAEYKREMVKVLTRQNISEAIRQVQAT
ncbi:FAD binding domain-containing protein [Chloroflexota bacterium]